MMPTWVFAMLTAFDVTCYVIIAAVLHSTLVYENPRARMLWSIFWPARVLRATCLFIARIVHAILHDEDLE